MKICAFRQIYSKRLTFIFLPTETFRKYQLLHLSRKCVKNYKIPGTDVTIEKGDSIVIPTFAIHHDEKFYPNPKKFDPSRFTSANKAGKSLVDMPYLTAGDGPRKCIGQNMDKIIAKVNICSILHQYHVDIDDRLIEKKMKLSLTFHPVNGIHLKLQAKQ